MYTISYVLQVMPSTVEFAFRISSKIIALIEFTIKESLRKTAVVVGARLCYPQLKSPDQSFQGKFEAKRATEREENL